MGTMQKAFLLHTKIRWLSFRKMFLQLATELHSFFSSMEYNFYLNDWQTVVIQILVFGRHFPNEQSVAVTQEKAMTIFVANDKIWTFEWELEFREKIHLTCELDSFPILSLFPWYQCIHQCGFFEIASRYVLTLKGAGYLRKLSFHPQMMEQISMDQTIDSVRSINGF